MLRLQLNRNGHSCILASAAMILEVNQQVLIDEIGHDGSEILWPDLKEPFCRRGFHMQEIIDCAWRRGYVILEISAKPVCIPYYGAPLRVIPMPEERFLQYVRNNKGILAGQLDGVGHACAWDGDLVYDPRGHIYSEDGCPMIVSDFYMFVDRMSLANAEQREIDRKSQ